MVKWGCTSQCSSGGERGLSCAPERLLALLCLACSQSCALRDGDLPQREVDVVCLVFHLAGGQTGAAAVMVAERAAAMLLGGSLREGASSAGAPAREVALA